MNSLSKKRPLVFSECDFISFVLFFLVTCWLVLRIAAVSNLWKPLITSPIPVAYIGLAKFSMVAELAKCSLGYPTRVSKPVMYSNNWRPLKLIPLCGIRTQ